MYPASARTGFLKRLSSMIIKCSKAELIRGINIVSKAVPVRTTLSIQECILIDASSDLISLTANDMEMGIETIISGEIKEKGTIAVNAKMFFDIVRKLPESDVLIHADDAQNVAITCEKARFRILAREWEEFSRIPVVEMDSPMEISAFTLREMIRQTIFSISANDSNKIMTGELFEIRDGSLQMVSLDGHRISLRRIRLKNPYPDCRVIIPGKTLNEISKILTGDTECMVAICISDNHILFSFDTTMVVSRLIEGNYYQIDQMITKNYETRVTINRRELMDCIDRSILLVREEDRKPIILQTGDDVLHLQINTSLGSMNETIDIETEGREIMIGFNPKYMLDALRAIDDETISMYFMNSKAPCFIRDEQDTYVYLILPVNFVV